MSRYYDQLIQYARVPGDDGLLFELIDCPSKSSAATADGVPDMSGERNLRSMVLLNGAFNHSSDIQGLLDEIAIYAVALSEDQILNHYHAATQR